MIKPMKQPTYPIIVAAVFLAVVAYSFAPVFIKLLLAEGMDPAWMATLRLGGSAVFLTPLALARKTHRTEIRSMSGKQRVAAVLASLFLAGHFVTWILALKYTTSLASTAIICTQTIFSALFSRMILKEKQSVAILIGLGASIAGTLVISWSDLQTMGNMTGSIIAIISSVLIALYYVMGRIARQSVSLTPYTWLVYAMGAIFLVLYAVITSPGQCRIPSWNSAVYILGLIFICTYLGHSVVNWALKYTQAAFISTMTLLQPIWTYLWGILILMETAGQNVFIGAAMILAGLGAYIPINRMLQKRRAEK